MNSRELTYAFMNLPHVLKLQAASELGLYDREADAELEDKDLYIQFFIRAKERNLLQALEEKVVEKAQHLR